MKFKKGSILEATETHIAHQCNCLTVGSFGLAKKIFDKYPEANTYRLPEFDRVYGSISVHKISENRTIINLYSQFYPGFPKRIGFDGIVSRLKAFFLCLFEVQRDVHSSLIAIPKGIGCGLGGGNLELYERTIRKFEDMTGIEFVSYELP